MFCYEELRQQKVQLSYFCLNLLKYALQIQALRAGNICCFRQPRMKGCLDVPEFESCSSVTHPDAMTTSDESGSKIFYPGRVSHLWFGSEFGKFPQIFQFFSLRVKKKSRRVGSESNCNYK